MTLVASALAMARRVEIVADERMNLRRYDYPAAAVTVRLKDGRNLQSSVTSQRGDFSNPAPREELLAKFRLLASEVWDEETIQRIIDTVGRLDELESITELTELLSTPA